MFHKLTRWIHGHRMVCVSRFSGGDGFGKGMWVVTNEKARVMDCKKTKTIWGETFYEKVNVPTEQAEDKS